MTKDIHAPSVGEGIQIGQYTNSFSISLSDELLASLQMSKVSAIHNDDSVALILRHAH